MRKFLALAVLLASVQLGASNLEIDQRMVHILTRMDEKLIPFTDFIRMRGKLIKKLLNTNNSIQEKIQEISELMLNLRTILRHDVLKTANGMMDLMESQRSEDENLIMEEFFAHWREFALALRGDKPCDEVSCLENIHPDVIELYNGIRQILLERISIIRDVLEEDNLD